MTEIQPEPIKLAAMYARVSTAKQEDEGTIDTQIAAVKEFAQKNGYKIIQEYKDEGWSGDILARPALDQLRQDAKRKIWGAVVMYDSSRLARRYSFQELVMDELQEAGVEVMFATSPAPRNYEEKILYGVRGLFAEYERAKITERFRFGKIRKAKEGHIVTGTAKYGYIYIPRKENQHGYYEVNQVEREVVEQVFHMIGDDRLTIRRVIKKLEELRIKPRKSVRGVWSSSTLATMLRDRTYLGEAHFMRTRAVVPERPFKEEGYKKIRKTSRRIRPKEEWITIAVPQLIDEELFERVQRQLDENAAQSKRNKKNEYLLSGRIWCSCGKRRAGEGPQHGKHLYYRCTDRITRFPLAAGCKEAGINARVADSLVWERLTSLMSTPELMLKQIERWRNRQKERSQDVSSPVEHLKREISRLKIQGDRYNKAYGAGVFTIEQLKEYADPVREEIARMESGIMDALSKQAESVVVELPGDEDIDEFATRATRTLRDLTFGAKREIVMSIIERVVGTKHEINVTGRIPVETRKHVGFKTNYSHAADVNQHNVGFKTNYRYSKGATQHLTNPHVEFKTESRYGTNTTRHALEQSTSKLIPFAFTIKLPPPRYKRVIVSRSPEGRIVRSVAA